MKSLASVVLGFCVLGGLWFFLRPVASRVVPQPLKPHGTEDQAPPGAENAPPTVAGEHLSRSRQAPPDPIGESAPGTHQVTVRGLLLGTDGQPCGGTVEVLRAGSDGRFHFAGRTLPELDGKFQLRLKHAGPFRLLAGGADPRTTGNVMLEVPELDPAAPPQDLVLQLVGPGSLRGQVLDENSRPLPGLRLAITTQAADALREDTDAQEAMDKAYRMQGAGLHRRGQSTDSMGRFEFHGLRDDKFIIRTTNTSSRTRSVVLTPGPVQSNGDPLTLFYERPHLLVQVLDGGHEPVPVQTRMKDDWPIKATVLVLPLPKQSDGDNPGRVGSRNAAGPGKRVFDLSTGNDYMVYVLAQGQATQSARVSMHENSGRVERVFVLNKPKPMGQLTVAVVDPSGTAVESRLGLRLLDPRTGVCIVKRSHFPTRTGNPWPAVFTLPVGDYTLEVISTSAVDGMHGTLVHRRSWGEFVTEVPIKAGQSKEVVAQLPAPAWIDLQVSGVPNSDDLEVALRHNPWLKNPRHGTQQRRKELDLSSSKTRVRLWRTSGSPLPVNFLERGELWESNTLTLGSQCTSEALPAGNFRLTLNLPGGRLRSRNVLLVAGEVLKVEVDFGQ